MAKRIALEFDNGKVFQAELLEAQAPETCRQMWDALPIEEELGHGLHSGSVLNVHTPALQVRRYENTAVLGMQRGDIYLDLRLLNDEIRGGWQEIRIVYGPAMFFSPQIGYSPCNGFATIVDGSLAELRALGSAVHSQGYQKIKIRRVDG